MRFCFLVNKNIEKILRLSEDNLFFYTVTFYIWDINILILSLDNGSKVVHDAEQSPKDGLTKPFLSF